jgi:hypothetical protein
MSADNHPARDVTNSAFDNIAKAIAKEIAGLDFEVPTDLASRTQSTLVVIETVSGNESARLTLWLHSRQKRTCWYFKALHEYEAWVTTGADPGSPRHAVDKIELYIARDADHANYRHACQNTDYCAKSDEIYATGGACGRSCGGAKAWYRGVAWATPPGCIG